MIGELGTKGKKTLGVDKHYDNDDFCNERRKRKVAPHVAMNIHYRKHKSAIDGRTTRNAGYEVSQRKSYGFTEDFGQYNLVFQVTVNMKFFIPVNKILAVLFILCSSVFTASGACYYESTQTKRPVAVKGVIDLRGWDFERDGPLNLDGEWEFCRDRLLNPSDFSETYNHGNCGFITVPGLWKGKTVNGISLPGQGRATYRLKIICGRREGEKALSLLRIFSAYRLWINGIEMASGGSVDEKHGSGNSYIFIHNVKSSLFTPGAGVNEIILQVADYQYESGGIGRPVLLEDAKVAAKDKFRKHTVGMIVFGLLMFSFIYNFILFIFHRLDAVPLYFGYFCLGMALNTLNHHFPILPSYPGNPYFINYLTIILSFSACILTVRSLFPDEFSKHAACFFLALIVIFLMILIFSGFRAAELMMRVCFASVIIFVSYAVYVFIKAINNRRDDVILFLIGFIPVLLAGVNDSLYAMWVINTTAILQYVLILLCIVTTMVISRRFARAHRRVKDLSADLVEKNISLEKTDRIKDQFLASTSHELRTPLHGIIGLSEAMLEGSAGDLSPNALENLSLMIASGYRLSGMINDLLDIAKMQDEGLNLNLRTVDLYSISEMVVKLSLPLVAKKSLRIINNIKPDIPGVHADEDRIRQVLHNLVGNAIKFTSKGTIELNARVTDAGDENIYTESRGMVEVSVSDTGIGVPEEYREKIFKAYHQVDGGDTTAYLGTGLGLAIAREIVELHGGKIRVEPGNGEGSVFIFTIPVSNDPGFEIAEGMISQGMDDSLPDEKNYIQHGLPAGMSNTEFDGHPVLLVVDDDPVNIRVIQNYFESKNCEVKTASDGISTLDIINNDRSIDLVLLDIMMPVMSGYDVCKMIRTKRSPEELPVIMLTAKNMMADIDTAFEAGANDYIVKPFRLFELFTRVSTMLKLRNIRRSISEGITVHCRTGKYSFKFSEIIYISSHLKNIVIHTRKHDIEKPILMKDIIDRLPPDIFVRIHKSHIINIQYLHGIFHVLSGRYRVRLIDDDETELPVGAAYLESLRKKI
jgi:two-component system sensor histidine kinase ChiS